MTRACLYVQYYRKRFHEWSYPSFLIRGAGVSLEPQDCCGVGASAGADPVLRGDGLLPGPGLPAARHIRVRALQQTGDPDGVHEQILQTSMVSETR